MSVPISGILIWELISDEKDGYDLPASIAKAKWGSSHG